MIHISNGFSTPMAMFAGSYTKEHLPETVARKPRNPPISNITFHNKM
jgi:hypothetical protein